MYVLVCASVNERVVGVCPCVNERESVCVSYTEKQKTIITFGHE